MTVILPNRVEITPEFRIAVQEVDGNNVRIIIHANGHDSDTLDRWVVGDTLVTLEDYIR